MQGCKQGPWWWRARGPHRRPCARPEAQQAAAGVRLLQWARARVGHADPGRVVGGTSAGYASHRQDGPPSAPPWLLKGSHPGVHTGGRPAVVALTHATASRATAMDLMPQRPRDGGSGSIDEEGVEEEVGLCVEQQKNGRRIETLALRNACSGRKKKAKELL